MNGRLNHRLTEELFARPVLMSVAQGLVSGPFVALILWFGSDRYLTVSSYLFNVIVFVLAMTFASFYGVRLARKKFPAGMSPQDLAEVRRIVWLGLPVSRPELAPAVLAHSQATLKQRADVFLLIGGCLLLVLGAMAPLIYDNDSQTIRSMIMSGVLAAGSVAYIPYVRRIRTLVEQARDNAERVLGMRGSAVPASAEWDPEPRGEE